MILGLLLVGCAAPPRVSEPQATGQAASGVAAPGAVEAVPLPGMPPTPSEGAMVVAAGPTRIGLMLPLSGPLAPVGKAILNAAEMALFDLGGEDFQLLPRDTGGTPEGAAAAARMLADEGAALILGPLLAPEVVAAGGAIQDRGISMIAFSNDRSVARDGVFVMGLQPSGEVQRIIGYAAARGLKNFGVLAPDNAYGSVAVQAMQQAVPLTGGTVARIAFVRSGADARETASTVQRFARSGGPMDVLLLPMGGAQLMTVAPLLPYYEVDPKQVQFIGTGLWEQGEIGMEPALASGWYAAPPPDERADFVKFYMQFYGAAPPRIATLGYDATALAAVLAQATRPDRFSIDAITQPNGFAGVDGLFRFRPDGTAERGLAVLQVNRSGPRLLDPAPQRFGDLTN